MNETIQYSFEGQTYRYDYDGAHIHQAMSRAEIQTQDAMRLALLKVQDSLLLPMHYEWREHELWMTYDCPMGDLFQNGFDERWTTSRRLRLLLQLLEVEHLEKTDLQTVIHPSNLYLDYNDCPYFIYRGVKNIMLPTKQASLLYEVKCFAASLFTKHSYDALYDGLLNDLDEHSLFMKELLAIDEWAQLRPFLTEAYHKAIEDEKKHHIVVKRQRFTLFKQLSIWFGVAIILIAVPLIYLLFVQIPTNKACLSADTSFLSKDYEEVITDLEKVNVSRLPQTQKYELAYSYVQGKGFDARQRRNIMKNITLKSDDQYLDYWILDGRGEFDKALSTAKSLEDSNLILYALLQKMDDVKKDKKLKDREREEQLKSLQEEYKTITDEVKNKGEKG